MVHASSRPQDRRQRRRAARTEHLLDAAQHVLIDEGADGLTMARVAAEADVAVGGLYRYFAGKDGLLAALQVRAVTAFDAVLVREMAAHEPGSLDRVRAAAGAWRRFADADPALFGLLDASLSDPEPNLDDRAALAVDEALRPVLGRVASALDAAVASGQLAPGDSALRTHALLAAVHGAAHLRKRERLGSPSADAVRDAMIEGLLAGWGPAGIRSGAPAPRAEHGEQE